MTRPRVVLLTRFTALAASSRYRFYQYIPFLEASGFECVTNPLLPDTYLQGIYRPTRVPRRLSLLPSVVPHYIQRLRFLVSSLRPRDVVLVQYEALPYLPFSFERLLFADDRRVIVDFDDAWHLRYQLDPATGVSQLGRNYGKSNVGVMGSPVPKTGGDDP
jgi:hypothetical protein